MTANEAVRQAIADYYAIAKTDAPREPVAPRQPTPTFDADAWLLVPEFVDAPTPDNPNAVRRQGPLHYQHRKRADLRVLCLVHGCELRRGDEIVGTYNGSEAARAEGDKLARGSR